MTEVILTGTGIPLPTPGRAGPGALVRHESVALQFDAGRGTVLRLADAGTTPAELTALFLTHIHSDHLIDLADVTMTRWLQQRRQPTGPLHIVATEGDAAHFVRHMFDVWENDIRVRVEHVNADPPEFVLHTFDAPKLPTEIWQSDDGSICVDAVAVHHEPVEGAVAYRVRTPDGVVVISGDTRVCAEVESFAEGAQVLVHEVCRRTAMKDSIAGTAFEKIFSYHADSVELAGLAERAGVKHLVLTHLIPSPRNADEESAFIGDLRHGGFTGVVTVGRDLDLIRIDARGVQLQRADAPLAPSH